MKLTKEFRCVPTGEIYPVSLQPGDECPAEFEESARSQGAFDEVESASGSDGENASGSEGEDTVPADGEGAESAQAAADGASEAAAADQAEAEDAAPAASKKKN